MLCNPKKAGGLVIKIKIKNWKIGRLEDWNQDSMMRHIWNRFVQSGSLWVAWVKV
jgi:hypothetical protein